MTVYIAKEDRGIADTFLQYYSPYMYQGTLEGNKKEARQLRKETLYCRFCKKDRAHTKFTQDTHLISKLLGKNAWYSHDECNTCNQQFKLYENDLASYLGADRVFNHILPGITPPGFESANGNIKIKKKNDFILLEKQEGAHDDFQVDMNKGTVSVKMETQRFRPVHVYKALLKMALGILPVADVPDYALGFEFLLNMENYPEMDYYKRALVTETGLTVARPYAQLFERLPDVKDPFMPKHIFCLIAGHQMFQLPLPGHRDFDFKSLQKFRLTIAPYIQLNTMDTHDGIVEKREVADLRSGEQTTKDNSINFGFSTENLKAVKLDFDITDLFKKKDNGS